MTVEQLQPYLLPLALVAFFGYRFAKFRRVRAKLPELLARGAVVVDVRTRGEYQGGARPGSVNIPLNELAQGAEKLDREKPVIVCCASGTRSAMAAGTLKRMGFKNVVNGGPWQNTL